MSKDKKSHLFYRGLNPQEYEEYLKTGELAPSNRHGVVERDGRLTLTPSLDRATIMAGRDGHIVSVDATKHFGVFHDQMRGAYDSRKVTLAQGDSVAAEMRYPAEGGKKLGRTVEGAYTFTHEKSFRIKSDMVNDVIKSADRYDEVIDTIYGKGTGPVLEGGKPGQVITTGDSVRRGQNTYRLTHKETVGNAFADERHAGEWWGQREAGTGGRMHHEEALTISEADLRAAQERIRIKNTPVAPKTSPENRVPEPPKVQEPPKVVTPPKVVQPPKVQEPKRVTTPTPKPAPPKSQESRVPTTPKVPKKPAEVPKKPSVLPQTPRVKELPRVVPTKPKVEPVPPKPQGATPATVANSADKSTVKEVMNENKKLNPGKLSPAVDTAQAEAVVKGNKTNATVSDMTTEDIKAKVIDPKDSTTRAVKGLHGVRTLAIVGVTLFGAGVMADISNKMSDKRMVERQKRIQEDNLRNKEQQEDKAMRKMFGYNYMDYSNIVGELWDNRTGHHKMGNAKFQ